MKKIILVAGVLFFVYSSCAYAQGTESITLTTYYPSPYGSYNQLQANRLAIGDVNGNGQLDAGDLPISNGDINVAGNINVTGNITVSGSCNWITNAQTCPGGKVVLGVRPPTVGPNFDLCCKN